MLRTTDLAAIQGPCLSASDNSQGRIVTQVESCDALLLYLSRNHVTKLHATAISLPLFIHTGSSTIVTTPDSATVL